MARTGTPPICCATAPNPTNITVAARARRARVRAARSGGSPVTAPTVARRQRGCLRLRGMPVGSPGDVGQDVPGRGLFAVVVLVARGGVEPPTFRFQVRDGLSQNALGARFVLKAPSNRADDATSGWCAVSKALARRWVWAVVSLGPGGVRWLRNHGISGVHNTPVGRFGMAGPHSVTTWRALPGRETPWTRRCSTRWPTSRPR